MAICAASAYAHSTLNSCHEFKWFRSLTRYPSVPDVSKQPFSETTCLDRVHAPQAQAEDQQPSYCHPYAGGQVLNKDARDQSSVQRAPADIASDLVMEPQRHRDIFAEMSGFSGAFQSAVGRSQETNKQDVVSPRGIHDTVIFNFASGAVPGFVDQSISASMTVANTEASCTSIAPAFPAPPFADTDGVLACQHHLSHHSAVAPHQGPNHAEPVSALQPASVERPQSSSVPVASAHLAQPPQGASYPAISDLAYVAGSVKSMPEQQNTEQPAVVPHVLVPCSSEQPQCAPPSVVVPPSAYNQGEITPWLDEQSVSGTCAVLEDEKNSSGQNMLIEDTEDARASQSKYYVRGSTGSPPSVMPPTAKSILERRERAIREGRRHEAKLNDEERRILRRLRNRESAERCAKRKHEQADLLARKISTLERENRELRTLASEYESEISRLERYILSRPLSQPATTWAAEP